MPLAYGRPTPPPTPDTGQRCRDRVAATVGWSARRWAGAVVLVSLACQGSERRFSPDQTSDAGVAAPDGQVADAGRDDYPAIEVSPPDVREAGADLRDADPLANIGVCDPQKAFLKIRTDDGKASIAAVEAIGCLRSPRMDCWPGGDAGGTCAAVELMARTGDQICKVTLTSTGGLRAQVTAEVRIDQARGFQCKITEPPFPRVITNYPLYFDPAEVVIAFGRDGGARD